jgi:Family of unknown function (DUF6055)
MSIERQLKILLAALPPALESEHFIIHFWLRNPLTGKGMGVHGVRDRMIILTYVEALEDLYRAMTALPWQRQPPPTDSTGKSHVYVLDSSPFTIHDSHKVPFIVLSCRSNEPTTQAELHRAAAEAVHEGTHLFNYRERPMYDPNSDIWEWFDEGLAVLMEMLVASGNPDYFRFLMDWIDMPEMSLDDQEGHYQAGMFIRYLTKKMGIEFVNKVWLESKIEESPLEAIERMMPPSQKFLSADPSDKDIFASGYCVDPYFIWEHASASVAPDVFLRYGERAISESKLLRVGTQAQIEGQLNHLACRYYRFFLKSDVTRVRIDFSVSDPHNTTPFKAEVAFVAKDRQRIAERHRLFPVDGKMGATGPLSTILDGFDPDDIDHLVLVVSNCGTRTHKHPGGKDTDDKKDYTITASAFREWKQRTASPNQLAD